MAGGNPFLPRPTIAPTSACSANLYQHEGWDTYLGDYTSQGVWSVPESQLHINFLKLKSVLLALKQSKHLFRDKIVLIALDNTTVVSHINKEGGMRLGSVCAFL